VNDAAGGCTNRQQNTHITESKAILYRWHPWCGRTVFVFSTIAKNEEIIFRCALEPHETARVLEVPQWMFDPVACCHVTCATSPAVDCAALRELKPLLADKPFSTPGSVIKAGHQPLPCTGGADASHDKPASGRSAQSDSAVSKDAAVGAPAASGPAADAPVTGTIAAATPARAVRRRTRSGGA
jgi:hypothetical protein